MSDKKKKHFNVEADNPNVEAEKTEEPKESEVEAETSEAPKEEAKDEAKEETKDEAKNNSEDKYLRLLADYQNLKRRTEQEKGDIYAFANEKIVKDMLDVIDNFDRALSTETQDSSYKAGMELIFKQFMGALEKAGVKEIEALGKEFDPNFHNAVLIEDNTDFKSGEVSCVMQKGYTLNGRVVRPSMVKVAN